MDHDKLPAPAALILASAADGPIHGYAIGKEVERRTDGEVTLGATTLYRVVRQLLESGYLAESAALAGVPLETMISTDHNLYLEYATPRGNVLPWSERDVLVWNMSRHRDAAAIQALIAD